MNGNHDIFIDCIMIRCLYLFWYCIYIFFWIIYNYIYFKLYWIIIVFFSILNIVVILNLYSLPLFRAVALLSVRSMKRFFFSWTLFLIIHSFIYMQLIFWLFILIHINWNIWSQIQKIWTYMHQFFPRRLYVWREGPEFPRSGIKLSEI